MASVAVTAAHTTDKKSSSTKKKMFAPAKPDHPLYKAAKSIDDD